MCSFRRALLKGAAVAFTMAAFAFGSSQAQAFSPFTGCIGNGGGNNGNGGGNGGGGGGAAQGLGTQGIQRATGQLANPVNFKQYAQITGVGPIVGTVRIYNQFGVLAMQGSQGGGGLGGGGLGGLGGGFGGFGGGGFGGGGGGQQQRLPGMGVTGQGDDPPQGVLLHVNYANMFLPNQQQINGGGGQGFNNGGLGGLGGLGLGGLGYGGKGLGGFGGFGNGGHGL